MAAVGGGHAWFIGSTMTDSIASCPGRCSARAPALVGALEEFPHAALRPPIAEVEMLLPARPDPSERRQAMFECRQQEPHQRPRPQPVLMRRSKRKPMNGRRR